MENQVGTLRARFFKPQPRFGSLDDLNGWLADRCVDHAKNHAHPERRDMVVWEMFEIERPGLVPYVKPFDGFQARTVAVSRTCLVQFDRNRYSVMASAVGRPAELRAYAERTVVRQDGRVVAEHARSFGRDQTVYDPWHTVPCWCASRGRCATARPSATGYCPLRSGGCARSSRARPMATGRWCASSPRWPATD